MPSQRQRIWGWMSFDWATQPFYTLGLTFIFGPYFATVVSQAYMADGVAENVAKADAQSMWSLAQTLAGLFIAFSAPIFGAYVDSSGKRMPWMILFSVIYVLGSWALWYMVPDGSMALFCLTAFVFAYVAAEFALILVNAVLPSLGSKDEIGQISGSGAAFGYWGGVLALFIMLLFFYELNAGKTILGLAPAFGLDPAQSEGTRAVGPFTAIWFLVFMVPYFMWVCGDSVQTNRIGFKTALGDLRRTLSNVRKRPSLLAFLIGSMFYRDALAALYAFGGVYSALVLDWQLMDIAIFGILSAVMAAIVTYIGGRFDRRVGPKPVIIVCVVILILVSVTIVSMTREAIFGISFGDSKIFGLSTPDLIFYICGAAIGGSGGVLYSASRSLMVRHSDPDRPTEAFGLFALSGKATAFLAPGLITLFTFLLKDARLGFMPVILLFIVGLVLLRWVEPEGDRT